MTAVAKKVRFNRFDAGDSGVLAAVRAPDNSYSGMDAVVYADGNIGPRCGLAFIPIDDVPVGRLTGFGILGAVDAPYIWFAVGSVLYRVVSGDPTGTAEEFGDLTDAGGGVSAYLAWVEVGGQLYVTSNTPGTGVYRPNSPAAEVIVGSDDAADPFGTGGQALILYGERLLWSGRVVDQNRVYYTDTIPVDGSLPTFDRSLNYFDVGFGYDIVGMWSLRDRVYIAKSDGTWWVYTGVPGVSDSLRQVYQGQSIPAAGAVMGASSVWFVGEGEDFPSYFNGSVVNTFDDQECLGRLYGEDTNPLQHPAVSVIPLARRGDILLLAGAGVTTDRTSLVLRENRWSRHSVRPALGVSVPGGNGVVFLTDGGSDIAAPKFYAWQATGWNRPPDGDDTYAAGRPGADDTIGPFDTTFTLPEFLGDGRNEVTVRKVWVDFLSYFESGLGGSNHQATVTVTPTRILDGSTPAAVSKPLVLNDTGSDAGDPIRLVADLGQQASGHGALVTISAVRGCSIEQIELDVVEVASRP